MARTLLSLSSETGEGSGVKAAFGVKGTMKRLLLATTNPGKVREFQDLLASCGWELVTPQELDIRLDVKETGRTYAENARLKAQAFAEASGLITLADDSGLEVDALGGAPGIHSARYGGPGLTDEERVQLLLRALEGVPDEQRTARFQAVIAIATPDGRVYEAVGTVEGRIVQEPRGADGFGYDPVFFLPERGQTMAELPPAEKNRISHRARAAQQARLILKALGH